MLNTPTTFFIKSFWILLSLLLILIIYYLVNIGNEFIPKRKRIKVNNKKVLPVVGALIVMFLLYNIYKKYTVVSDTVFAIILSIIIAFALNPIINYLETKKINRFKGVLIVYISILAVFLIFAFLIIPKSGKEIKRLFTNLPSYMEQGSDLIDSLYSKYYSTLGGLPPMFQGVETVIMDNIVKLENFLIEGLKGVITGLINALSKVLSIVLTPILTLYFLVDKEHFKKRIIKILPNKYRDDILELSNEINYSLTQFVKGRLIMSLYVGVSITILLLVMRIEFAIVIGFITGFADIIPYLGPLLGFLPAVFFAFLSSPIKALWVSVFFVLIQWTENNLLAPKIIGENLGMHPMIILLSIVIGGGIFGVLGMIISVPTVAVVKIVVLFIKDKLRKPPEETLN